MRLDLLERGNNGLGVSDDLIPVLNLNVILNGVDDGDDGLDVNNALLEIDETDLGNVQVNSLGNASINQSLEIFNDVISSDDNVSNLLALVFSDEGRSSLEHRLRFLGTSEDVSLENEFGILVNLTFVRNGLNSGNSALDGTNNGDVILILELLGKSLEVIDDGGRISNAAIEVVEVDIGNV